ADLISFGVALTFVCIGISLIHMRTTQPELVGRFRVPLGGVWIRGIWFGTVPVLAIVVSIAMTLPVTLDLIGQARRGEWLPTCLMLSYLAMGIAIYTFYGRARVSASWRMPAVAAPGASQR
ncbi:MAG TPA: hypothetical protein VGC23_00915, partial [Vicinamibacterales bacterium]